MILSLNPLSFVLHKSLPGLIAEHFLAVDLDVLEDVEALVMSKYFIESVFVRVD